MDSGPNSVFVYCSGLNSAIFTEWDSIQYSFTALVLNSTVIATFMDLGLNSVFVYCFGLKCSHSLFIGTHSAIFTEWDSIQYSYTALVLNSTVIATFMDLGLNSVFVYCFGLKCNRNSYIY